MGADRAGPATRSRGAADDALCVDAADTATIQEIHLIAIHLLCAAVDEALPARAPALSFAGGARMSLVVVGDVLLDRDLDGRAERLAPDAPVPVVDEIVERPRPGGAGLAAALAAAIRTRRPRSSARWATTRPGRRVADLLGDAGVRVCDLGLEGATPEKMRVRVGGRALVRLDSGGGDRGCGAVTAEVERVLRDASAVLVSDYGGGIVGQPLGPRRPHPADRAGRLGPAPEGRRSDPGSPARHAQRTGGRRRRPVSGVGGGGRSRPRRTLARDERVRDPRLARRAARRR